MRTRVLIGLVLVAAFAAYAAEETPEPDEYVVWVDELNMRVEPSSEAEVVAVLERGDELTDLGEEIEGVDDLWWRHVRASENEGWVADWLVLPRAYYDAFRGADELGKAGKAEEMVAAAIEGGKEIGIRGGPGENYYVSPDGKNIILCGDWDYFDWGGNYPGFGRVPAPFPILLFASGRGLVDYSRSYAEISGKWSPDSRYFGCTAWVVAEYNYEAALGFIDADRRDWVYVGTMVLSPLGEGFFEEYGFADGYLIWLSEVPVEEPGPPPLERDSATSVLYAYELATGRKLTILKADMETLEEGEPDIRGWHGMEFFRVKMVNADPCPPAVEKSDLYIKYRGNYGYAVNREHYLE